MRILHLLGSDEDTGGVLSTVRNVQEATWADGLEHLSWVNARFQQTRQPALELRRSRHLVMETPNYAEFLWRGIRAFGELRSLLRREPCDVLHAHSRGPLVVVMIAALLTRRAVVFSNHAFARQRWFYRCAARWPRLVTTVLTPNMAAYYGLAPSPGRIEVISECCADLFFSEPLSARRGDSTVGPIRILGLGNLIRWKKWELIVQAVAQLPKELQSKIEVRVFGPIPGDDDSRRYAEELTALVRQHRLSSSIHFPGPIHDIPETLAAADWFVLPSTNEPCSVALIEALAMGVPALVTASGGNVDIVKPGMSGQLFEPDRVDSLARALKEIAEGRSVSWSPAEIRESVRDRSAARVGQQFATLYRALV